MEFDRIHGAPITAEAIGYRVKTKGMSKEEAVMTPPCKRGRSSERKKLTVGRRVRRQQQSGLTYLYLHVECPGKDCLPRVRYVGKGQEGRAFSFKHRQDQHEQWIKSWFTAGVYQYSQLGINPAKLRDLSWLDTSTRKQAIITSHPFETADAEEERLVHFHHLAGEPLFNRVLYNGDSHRINCLFRSRPCRIKRPMES